MDKRGSRRSSVFNCSFLIAAFLILVGTNPNAFITESTAQIYNKSNLVFEQKVSKFIGKGIISNYLFNCSLIIVTTTIGTRQENKTSFSSDMTTELSIQVGKNLNTTTTLISLSNERVSRKDSLQRFTTTCNTVVTIISAIIPRDCHLLQQLISTSNKEVTKKDEDYYIFIATSEQVSRSLLNSKTALLLRYKIVIYPHTNVYAGLFSIQTLCIYCPEATNRIIPIVPKLGRSMKTMSLSSIFPDPTRNLQRFLVRITAPTKYLSTYQMQNLNGRYRHKRGIHTLVFNTVAEKILNMSYTLQPCSKFGSIPEGASGVLLGNGTWAGCMGDVIRGISDMSLSISPDDRRFLHVHFTAAIEYTSVTYTTSKPGLFYSWKTVFTALEVTSWVLVIASILVTSTAIYLMDHHHHRLDMEISNDANHMPSKLFETGLYLMGYIVGQDVPPPRAFSSKFIYMIWLYYGLLIGAIYACSLQALIVSPGLDYVPRTFSELIYSRYKWGAASSFRNGLGEQLFKNSGNPVMRAIYHKMEGDPDVVTCTRKALSQYACFNWEIMERFYFQTEFADKTGNHPFQMSTETSFFTSLNFITRKRELYRSHFNNFISRSFDSGLVKQTIAMDWREYRMKIVKAKKEGKFVDLPRPIIKEGPSAFQIDNVKGCFIALFCGLATSMVSFLWEKIISKACISKQSDST